VLPDKRRLDQLYVRHRSFWLDWDVLFWTLVVLLPRLRTFKPPEESIYWGPVSRFGRRHLSWFSVDTLTASIVFGATALILHGLDDARWTFGALLLSLIFAASFGLTGALLGANRIIWSKASLADVLDLIPGWLVGATAAALVSRSGNLLPSSTVGLAAGLFFWGAVAIRYRQRVRARLTRRFWRLSRRPIVSRERVLIVGSGEAGQFAAWQLQHFRRGPNFYHLIGFVDDDVRLKHARISGIRVLGKSEDIPALVEEHDVGLLVFAIHNIAPANRKKLLNICSRSCAKLVCLPDFLGRLHGRNSTARARRERAVPRREFGAHETSPLSYGQLHAYLGEVQQAARQGEFQIVEDRLETLRQSLLTRSPAAAAK
jgi:hypothetical protein